MQLCRSLKSWQEAGSSPEKQQDGRQSFPGLGARSTLGGGAGEMVKILEGEGRWETPGRAWTSHSKWGQR